MKIFNRSQFDFVYNLQEAYIAVIWQDFIYGFTY